MSDLIRRSDVIAKLKEENERGHLAPWVGKDVYSAVRAIPAVDAVEVVRCRECKFFDKGQNDAESWEWCNIWERDCESECYCRYGQRREDGDEDGLNDAWRTAGTVRDA